MEKYLVLFLLFLSQVTRASLPNCNASGVCTGLTSISSGGFCSTAAYADGFCTYPFELANQETFAWHNHAANGHIGLQVSGLDNFDVYFGDLNTKYIEFNPTSASNNTVASLAFMQTANRTYTFPDKTGTLALTSDPAAQVTVGTSTANLAYRVPYVSVSGGQGALESNSGFTVNPSTNTVTATTFAGTATNISGNLVFNQMTARDGAFYNSTETHSISATSTLVDFPTKVADTNNNVSSNVFTAAHAGWHQITAEVETSSVTWSAGDFLDLSIIINGTAQALTRTFVEAAFTQNIVLTPVSTPYYLSVNDTVQINARKVTSSATPTFSGNANRNYFSVVYLGP